jgi:hypothetical protein
VVEHDASILQAKSERGRAKRTLERGKREKRGEMSKRVGHRRGDGQQIPDEFPRKKKKVESGNPERP